MTNIISFLSVILFSLSCSNAQKAKIHEVNYECITQGFVGQMALAAYQTELETVKQLDVKVTRNEEKQLGKELYNYLKDKGLLNNTYKYTSKIKKLEKITKKLVVSIPSPRFDTYTLYAMNDKHLNAITTGGKIFITTALLDAIDNDDMWAFVLAHEIGHNELKHFYYDIKRKKFAGEFGDIMLASKKFFLPSLNQFNELEADCFAIDVMTAAGYNPYKSTEVINILRQNETNNNNYNTENEVVKKMVSSHPLYKERKQCIKKFIEKYYK